MSNEKFAVLCDGMSKVLAALAEQSRSAGGDVVFAADEAPDIIGPLAELIAAIADAC